MASATSTASQVYASLQATVLTCATTIFLCVWVAYHPNVPDRRKFWLRRKVERISQAIAGLLAPELVLMSAFKEYVFSSRALENLKKKDKHCKWTQTHAFFAYMGGFQLRNRDNSKGEDAANEGGSTSDEAWARKAWATIKNALTAADDDGEILYKYEFFRLAINGEIEIPVIKEEEINDRSKTSSLGKLIVVGQTMLFFMKFIFGAVPKDNTVPLGFVTLSLVLINIFCYGCWWRKPVSVEVPIPVYPKEPKSTQLHNEDHAEGTNVHWSNVTTVLRKVAYFLLLTVSGVVVSAINLFAIPFDVFNTPAENILWALSSAIVCWSQHRSSSSVREFASLYWQ